MAKERFPLPGFLFVLYLLWAPDMVQAQQPYFINYSVNEGLPGSEAYCVIQDKKGYIWASTDAGVARFDGYRFKTFTTQNGLSDNTVFQLVEDHRGRIWCGTLSGRICYYENNRFYTLPCNDSLAKIVGGRSIIKMDVDKNGVLYLCTHDLALTSVKPPYRKQDILPNPELEDQVIYLVKYGTRVLPLNSQINLWSFNKVALKDSSGTHIIKMGGSYPNTFRVTNRGTHTYVSCDPKIYFFDRHKFVDSVDMGAGVISLCEDSDGNLWAGAREGGIYIFERGTFGKKKPFHILNRESASFIYEDKEKGIWFTSLKNGLFYIPYPKVIHYTEMSFLDDNKVYSVTKTGNEILAGKSTGEIMVINCLDLSLHNIAPEDWKEPGTRTFKAGAVLNISETGDEIFFQGQQSFFCPRGKYDKKYRKYIVLQHPLTAIKPFNASGNNVKKKINIPAVRAPFFSRDFGVFNAQYDYFTAANWVHFLDKKHHLVFPQFSFPPARITALTNQDEKLWIASSNGLWAFKDSCFAYYGDSIKLFKNRIEHIRFIPDGRLVMATKAIGLIIWNPSTKKVEQLTTLDGLPSNTCKNLFVENDSIVWVATNKGLSKVNILDKEIKFNYTMDHGLLSNEINQVYVDDRYIWIATSHGLSCISRQQSFTNKVRPSIYITGMRVNSKELDLGSSVSQINYKPQQVQVMFTGLSYKLPGKCMYKYRLQGLHDSWYSTRSTFVEFGSLSPGDYTFEVYAVNNSGLLSQVPARLRFMVLAPFWMKTWFIIVVIVVFLLLVYLLFRFRLNLVKKREAKTSELNRALLGLKLKALRAQMNPHFTFNVMNSIQHFILEKDEESAHRYLSKFSKLIRIILQHSEEDTVPVAEEIKALELYLELEAMRFEDRFDYVIDIDPVIDINRTRIPSMLLQPYVENAIKHGISPLKNKGHISIRIEDKGHELKCVIEDNGVGRQKAAARSGSGLMHKSLGTSITKERLSVINAINNVQLTEKTIDLKDETGEPVGTRVEIYIPKN